MKKFNGLTEAEARRRLLTDGYNEIASAKKRGFASIASSVIKEPMIALLLIAGGLYLILGDKTEALFLLFFVFVIAGITLYQERKTERALEALRDLSSPRALVIRDNEIKRIAGRDVVAQDVVIISEGDRVPADGVLEMASNVLIDESLLTGESVPVAKISEEFNNQKLKLGGENTPFVFSGTLVASGWGVARIISTGTKTEMGKIGKSLSQIKNEKTNLEIETKKIVVALAFVGLSLCVVVGIVYGLTQHHWINGILNGLALAMAVIPEEFPVVLAVFLAIGAWRISKKNVLTRKTSAIETLGATTVLCVDKTGTLTENKMEVKEIINQNGEKFYTNYESKNELPENFHYLVETSSMESQKNPFNPISKAFANLFEKYLFNSEHRHSHWSLFKEFPVIKNSLAVVSVWKTDQDGDYFIATKGAIESVMDLCKIKKDKRDLYLSQASEMAKDGLRIFAVAAAKYKGRQIPENREDFSFEYLGLIGLQDPIRPTVKEAIKECYSAGVRIIMITGDYAETAQSIAAQIGLKNPKLSISGSEIDSLSENELESVLKDTNIFTRAVPEHKLKIINILKKSGEIVAMTGDGVNDAPALKSANIGIAMGEHGTDVAREASALVLMNDDFLSMVEAIKSGRRIFDNLRKAMAYILSVHIPIAGLSLIPVIYNWPLMLYPVHIVFLELIIDPACSVVFEAEPEEPDIMNRPPRKINEKIFNKKNIISSIFQGLVVTLIILFVFSLGLKNGMSEENLRAISFVILVVSNLGLILANLSMSESIWSVFKKNISLLIVVVGSLAMLGLVLYVPFLRHLFKFSQLDVFDIFIASILGALAVLMARGIKRIFRISF